MKRTLTLLLALSAAACTSRPAPARAQEPTPEAGQRIIHVDANATVRRAPDRAVVRLAVETEAATALQAMRENAEAMERVLAAVRRQGVPRDRIQTTRVGVYPRYDTRREREDVEPQIVGYVATNMVTVTTDSVPLVGTIIDAGVEAGANRVEGISFELRDPEAAHHEALRLAIQKARREAQVIAESLNERLGRPLRVTTSAYYAPPPPTPMMDMEMTRAAQQAPTPVEPGELDVQASVSITFSIGT